MNFKETSFSKNIGIDLTVLCNSKALPAQLQVYYINLLHSVIAQAKDYKFILFITDLSLSASIDDIFPFDNLSYKKVGEERNSNLDLYFMLDQLTIVQGRIPPLLISIRTVPTSLLIHNFVPLSQAGAYLQKWPKEVSFFYMHSLEMITAAATRIYLSGQIESQVTQQLSVPFAQTDILPLAAAIPFFFIPDDLRWQQLKLRLGLNEKFVIIPADLLANKGLSQMLQFFQSVNRLLPELQVLIPNIRDLVANYLPQIDRPKMDLSRIVYEPLLSYPEYLELLFRSSCLMITEDLSATCCVAEVLELGVPVCTIGSDYKFHDFTSIKLTEVEDLVQIVRRQQDPVFDSSRLAYNWRCLADKVISGWKLQLDHCRSV